MSAPPRVAWLGPQAAAYRPLLAAAGLAVEAVPPGADYLWLDGTSLVILEAGERPEAAPALCRRWRIELGERLVPILWLIPAGADASAALDAGADAALPCPVADAALVAQVRALVRLRLTAARLEERAADVDAVHRRYRELSADSSADRDFAERLTLDPCGALTLPPGLEVEVTAGGAGDFSDWIALGGCGVGFVLGSVAGGGPLTAARVRLLVERRFGRDPARPGAALLAELNGKLCALDGLDAPLVGLCVGTIDGATGAVRLARAGVAPPLVASAGGVAAELHVPGQLLGVFDGDFAEARRTLEPGESLTLSSRGDGGGLVVTWRFVGCGS